MKNFRKVNLYSSFYGRRGERNIMIVKINRYDKIITRGGGTHQKKRSATFKSRGEKPIIKNVEVADVFGIDYAPTYLRRAKGLVKAGRARWSDDNFTKIVMFAGPTQNFEEAKQMDIYDNDGNKISGGEGAATRGDNSAAGCECETQEGGPALSVGYILGQMEKIRADNGYIFDAFMQIEKINAQPPAYNAPDVASQARAAAIGAIVQSREATNQKLLAMYERMYEDLKPRASEATASEKERLLNIMAEMMKVNQSFGDYMGENLDSFFKAIFK